jgi:single-strand DNA-binding protein
MPIFATFTGRVGRDPETKEGGSYTLHTFSVGVERWDSKKKEYITDWVNVTFWGSNWGPRLRMVRKGSLVTISGVLSVEEFQQKDGIRRFVTKVTGSEFQSHQREHGRQQEGPPEEEVQPQQPALPKPPAPPPAPPADGADHLPF